MERPLDPVQQLADVVEDEPGSNLPEVSRDHPELPAPGRRGRRNQTSAERFVDGLPERPARLPGLSLELGGHVFIERQC